MRKLSKRFVVALTPEHGTSRRLQVSRLMRAVERGGGGKEDQDSGLAHLQDEDCKLPMNRDRLGASNIGFNFCRLFRGERPIRTMSEEERGWHRLATSYSRRATRIEKRGVVAPRGGKISLNTLRIGKGYVGSFVLWWTCGWYVSGRDGRGDLLVGPLATYDLAERDRANVDGRRRTSKGRFGQILITNQCRIKPPGPDSVNFLSMAVRLWV